MKFKIFIYTILPIFPLLIIGCQKEKSEDSLDNAVDEVLKKDQGVIIDISPKPKEKK